MFMLCFPFSFFFYFYIKESMFLIICSFCMGVVCIYIPTQMMVVNGSKPKPYINSKMNKFEVFQWIKSFRCIKTFELTKPFLFISSVCGGYNEGSIVKQFYLMVNLITIFYYYFFLLKKINYLTSFLGYEKIHICQRNILEWFQFI